MDSGNGPAIVWRQPVFAIGLTGAVGAGKSTVGRLFEERGARLLNADLVAREILHGPELRDDLLAHFGPGILDESGELSRERLADQVFSDSEKKEQLEGLIHPAVRRRYWSVRESLAPGSILVYDVPLLFEAGLEKDYDLIITVSAPAEMRLTRVRERSNWDAEELRRREAMQLPLSEKEKRADIIIRNDRTPADLAETVQKLYARIRDAAGPENSQ